MRILAPNKRYTGVIAGVSFNNGVGETNDVRLQHWFAEKGYQLEVPTKSSNKKKASPEGVKGDDGSSAAEKDD